MALVDALEVFITPQVVAGVVALWRTKTTSLLSLEILTPFLLAPEGLELLQEVEVLAAQAAEVNLLLGAVKSQQLVVVVVLLALATVKLVVVAAAKAWAPGSLMAMVGAVAVGLAEVLKPVLEVVVALAVTPGMVVTEVAGTSLQAAVNVAVALLAAADGRLVLLTDRLALAVVVLEFWAKALQGLLAPMATIQLVAAAARAELLG